MSTDITIPSLGESITEGTILTWLVAGGDAVETDQPLLELETDKVTAELPAPCGGVITELLFEAGTDVAVGAVVGRIDESASTAPPARSEEASPKAKGDAPGKDNAEEDAKPDKGPPLSPAVRRLIEEHGLNPADIPATGRGSRLLKGDVLAWLSQNEDDDDDDRPQAALASIDIGAMVSSQRELAQVHEEEATRAAPPPVDPGPTASPSAAPQRSSLAHAEPTGLPAEPTGDGRVRRVRMSRMRRAIARRLKEVQNTAAILTTFNEVDMSAVMALRAQHKEAFLKRHGVKLGFMSFFVKASIEALKEYPALNAAIEGDEMLFHDRYDIGVAVSSERGLVVPVIRAADRLSFAEIEKTLGVLAGAARDGSLSLEQLEGGTFSITNGGTFGSMLSTPILNPPQSGILGMHNIIRRPVAVGDQVEIRPVMYLALSYDHRIVDGAQAVRFLVKIKEILEDPSRLLLEI